MNKVRWGVLLFFAGWAGAYAAGGVLLATVGFDALARGDVDIDPGFLLLSGLIFVATCVKWAGIMLIGFETFSAVRRRGWRSVPRELWDLARTGETRKGSTLAEQER